MSAAITSSYILYLLPGFPRSRAMSTAPQRKRHGPYSLEPCVLQYVECCAVDSSLRGPVGDDQHGLPRLVQHTPADRTQQPTGQTAATAVPHHDECCAACGVKKHVGCRAFDKLEA